MKKWQIYAIITLLFSAVGFPETASHADEIEDLKKKLQFLEAKREIATKLDGMQSNIDALQKQLDDMRAQYDMKESTPSKPALQKQTQSPNKDGDFESLMVSLSKKNRRFSGVSTTSNFSFSKNTSNGKWSVQNINNGRKSDVISLGKNKIGMQTFPAGWSLNGIYSVTISASSCKLTQEWDKRIVLKWDCG